MKRPFLFFGVASLLISFAAGCELLGQIDPPGGSDAPESIIMLDEGAQIDTLSSDAASVEAASLHGSTLRMKVSYSGGCKEHDFKLYGSSAFVETSPVGAEIYLTRDANGDTCEAWLTRELSFDVRPVVRTYKQMYPDGDRFFINVHEPAGGSGAFEHIEADPLLYELE